MANRTFKLWAYSPSHSQLVIRGLPTPNQGWNEDHLFGGVAHVDMPHTIADLSVRVAAEVDYQPRSAPVGELHWYLLEGQVDDARKPVGFILARSYRHEVNELSQLVTPIDELLPEAKNALDLERRLLVAIAAEGLPMAAPDSSSAVDIVVPTPQGTKIAIEVKWFAGRPPERAIRSIVMRLAPSLTDDTAGVAVVVGGISNETERIEFSQQLARHLVTALPASVAHAVLTAEDSSVREMAVQIRQMLAT